MSKKKQILAKAKELMQINGSTTTMDIKTSLRKQVPNTKWVQSTISKVMSRAYNNGDIANLTFIDNGRYRTYSNSSVTTTYTNGSAVKNYNHTFLLDDGVTIDITAPKDTILGFAAAQGNSEALRYSESKDTFVRVADMHDGHVINSIKKDVRNMSTLVELRDYMIQNDALFERVVNATDPLES